MDASKIHHHGLHQGGVRLTSWPCSPSWEGRRGKTDVHGIGNLYRLKQENGLETLGRGPEQPCCCSIYLLGPPRRPGAWDSTWGWNEGRSWFPNPPSIFFRGILTPSTLQDPILFKCLAGPFQIIRRVEAHTHAVNVLGNASISHTRAHTGTHTGRCTHVGTVDTHRHVCRHACRHTGRCMFTVIRIFSSHRN